MLVVLLSTPRCVFVWRQLWLTTSRVLNRALTTRAHRNLGRILILVLWLISVERLVVLRTWHRPKALPRLPPLGLRWLVSLLGKCGPASMGGSELTLADAGLS